LLLRRKSIGRRDADRIRHAIPSQDRRVRRIELARDARQDARPRLLFQEIRVQSANEIGLDRGSPAHRLSRHSTEIVGPPSTAPYLIWGIDTGCRPPYICPARGFRHEGDQGWSRV